MMRSTDKSLGGYLLTIRRCGALAGLVLFLAAFTLPINAQTFDSGSTGVDGTFNPPTQVPPGTQVEGNCLTGCTIIVPLREPPNEVYNFTTINITARVLVRFTRNARNTPVTMLASGDVNIAGTIDLTGGNGGLGRFGIAIGGPAGFDGGGGGSNLEPLFDGTPGDGPGGGGGGKGSFNGSVVGSGGGGGYGSPGADGAGPGNGQGGGRYGTQTLLPLIGGSGGGGGGAFSQVLNFSGSPGGGGGGAILIASSGTIVFPVIGGCECSVIANGGRGGTGDAGGGGGGSGGAIRLIGTTISGRPRLSVQAGAPAHAGGAGGQGYIRMEAFRYNDFLPTVSPINAATISLPGPVVLPNAPLLRIMTVAGRTVTDPPRGSFHNVPDVVVPLGQPNPVVVSLQASNIPINTIVQVTLQPDTGTRATFNSGPLTGTLANSTATANVTLSAELNLLTATAVIDLTIANVRPMFINGERVDRIEVTASYGGASAVTYVTRSGKRFPGLR